MGVVVALRPVFTISLGVAATAFLGVFLQVFLWLERENFPGSPLAPNWNFAIAFGGVVIGYGVMRAPFVASSAPMIAAARWGARLLR